MGITLYKNADWILTVNEKREKFRHGDLLISGKEILDVGNDLEKKYAGKLQIDKTIDPSWICKYPSSYLAVTDPQYTGNKRSETGTMAYCYV